MKHLRNVGWNCFLWAHLGKKRLSDFRERQAIEWKVEIILRLFSENRRGIR